MRNIYQKTGSQEELIKTSFETLSFETLSFEGLINRYKINLSALSLIATETTSDNEIDEARLMCEQETLVKIASTLPIRSIENLRSALKLWKLEEVSDLNEISDSQKLVHNCLSASI